MAKVMDLSREEILALDPVLFSKEDKQALLLALYGNPSEWTWKRDLGDAQTNLRRWNRLLSPEPAGGDSFWLGHQELLGRARMRRPSRGNNTVSAFTDWVYRLYVPERDYPALLRGSVLEREVARRHISVPEHGKWKLIHNGLGADGSPARRISALAINGEPMLGSPDLVFREKKTGRILIIEVKVSPKRVPTDGWPNLRAQLWAYSQVDDWADAPEALLVGEVWGLQVELRRTLRWTKGDQPFERECADLFASYRNHLQQPRRGRGDSSSQSG